MTVSPPPGSREISVEEFERQLSAMLVRQAGAEDRLSKLARFFESLTPPPNSPPPSAPVVCEPGLKGGEPQQSPRPFDIGPQQPTIQKAHGGLNEVAADGAEVLVHFDRRDIGDQAPNLPDEARQFRSPSWKLVASALALAGAATISAHFLLKGGISDLRKNLSSVAATREPINAQPPRGETVASSSDISDSEKHPAAHSSPPMGTSAAAGAPQPAIEGFSATAVATTVDTPVVANSAPSSPVPASQTASPVPIRMVSVRPDGALIATSIASSSVSTDSSSASAEPNAHGNANGSAGFARLSTPKLDLAARPLGKMSDRVAVSKTVQSITSPKAESSQLPQSIKPKPTSMPIAVQAAAESAASATRMSPPSPQQPAFGLTQALVDLIHVSAALIQHPADPNAVAK
jgi:hypothetical protein